MYTYIDTIHKKNIDLFYSKDDEGYIARLTEMHTLSAFGDTPKEAMREMETVIELADDTTGDPLPTQSHTTCDADNPIYIDGSKIKFEEPIIQ